MTSNNDLNLTSQIVMSNDNLNLKSQFATLEKWDSIRSQNATIEGKPEQRRKYLPYAFTPKQWIEKTNAIGIVSKVGRYVGICGIAKCDTFNAVSGQQAVAQSNVATAHPTAAELRGMMCRRFVVLFLFKLQKFHLFATFLFFFSTLRLNIPLYDISCNSISICTYCIKLKPISFPNLKTYFFEKFNSIFVE